MIIFKKHFIWEAWSKTLPSSVQYRYQYRYSTYFGELLIKYRYHFLELRSTCKISAKFWKPVPIPWDDLLYYREMIFFINDAD
jgi:hypothetical protein